MSDIPKAGEVWVGSTGDEFQFVAGPDAGKVCAWLHDGRLVLWGTTVLRRKPAAPPTDVECWTNYYPGHHGPASGSADWCDRVASDSRTWRFDAYNNWVPCQGKTVLGPAVKGRP